MREGICQLLRTQKQRYEEHRRNIRNAKPYVHPITEVRDLSNLYDLTNLRDNTTNSLSNKVLVAINRCQQAPGFTNSFGRSLPKKAKKRGSKKVSVKRLTNIEMQNIHLANKVLQPRRNDLRYGCFVSTKKPVSFAYEQFQLPRQILAKYNNLKLPPTKEVQYKVFRPKIYLLLSLDGVRPLGRLDIELFTEAAPQVVCEFVRTCAAKQAKRISIVRLFACLWMEGELKLSSNSMAKKTLEYDMRALDHGNSEGILSCSTKFLEGFTEGYLNFSISFKPLPILNGTRIAFGRVTSGLKVLQYVQEYSSKNGRCRQEIFVDGCGLCH